MDRGHYRIFLDYEGDFCALHLFANEYEYDRRRFLSDHRFETQEQAEQITFVLNHLLTTPQTRTVGMMQWWRRAFGEEVIAD